MACNYNTYCEFRNLRKGLGAVMKAWIKVFLITAMILITAVVIVVCVSLFTGQEVKDYDGTLVSMEGDIYG